MKILKKASTLLLPATMVFGYIFVSNRKNKYIAAKNLTFRFQIVFFTN